MDVPLLIFSDEQEQACFESYFEGVDKSSVGQRLKGNAVLQRRINQEESDLNGKPICGVLACNNWICKAD